MNQHTTSRRTFIKAAGAAAFVVSAPMIIADDKPEAKNPILGEGQYKYECIHGWAKLPEGMRQRIFEQNARELYGLTLEASASSSREAVGAAGGGARH